MSECILMNDNEFSKNNKLQELDEELTEYYLEHIPSNLNDLKQAYSKENISDIRFQSHKLIPAMVLIGSHEVADSLKLLSDKSTNTNLLMSIAQNAINQIEKDIKRLKD